MAIAEIAQLLMLLVDLAAGANIDKEGYQYDDPDRAVESCNPENVPVGADPTPERCVSVHPPLCGRRDEDVGKGYDKGDSVAADEIGRFHSAQPLRVKLEVKSEVDVHSHGQGPESISRHEPVGEC